MVPHPPPQPDVRQAVMGNPATPQRLLDAGATDPDVRTRRVAVGRTSCIEHLRAAAASPEHELRLEAATRTDCPPDLIETLAEDPHPDVRGFLVTNPFCPDDLVLTLAEDPDTFVFNHARRELDRRELT